MKLLVGSYNENIYEVTINKKDGKFLNKELFFEGLKPSYLIPYNDSFAFIYMKDNLQYVKVGNDDVLIGNDTSCHLSYDSKNELIYSSHYHSGNLYTLAKNKNNQWDVLDKYHFTDHSHIHYAKYIPELDLLGVCDLGDNKFFLYEVINKKLVLKTSFTFNDNPGPRHFVFHKNYPIIYVILEHSGEVISLLYQNETLTKLQTISLPNGAAAAIRISKNGKYLYASERKDHTISAFEILEDGLLVLSQQISTYGTHPRDFNLSLDEAFLVVGNMHSNTLSLYERDLESGSLILLDQDFAINAPAVILFTK